MIKIMTIVGTRPELIKMSRVIAEFDSNVSHVLVHTGQNYDFELNQVFFDDLGIRRPDYFLEAAGSNASQTIARVIEKTDEVMEIERPDAIVVYGDTNSCLSVIAAKRRKIPIFHLEAGNRCFDQRVPEELNRKIVDNLSDINLVLTEHSRRHLLSEGFEPQYVIKVGSNMREVIDYNWYGIQSSKILTNLGLCEREFFLVSMHREENVDSVRNLQALVDSLNGLAETYSKPVIVSTHPRTQKRIDALSGLRMDARIRFLKPFGFHDYMHLQLKSSCVLSDSGTITEEASMLNLPAVTIRNVHERPEGMDVGAVVMSGLQRERVLDSVKLVMRHHEHEKRIFPPVADYENQQASKHILRIVLSYTDYVNRNVWSKYD